jgi:hypothetical protein
LGSNESDDMRVSFGFILAGLLSLFSLYSYGQTVESKSFFEGSVYYRYEQRDAKGNKVPFPIDEDELCFDEKHILARTIKGYGIALIGSKDVWLDAESKVALSINHDNQSISKMPDYEPEEILPIEFKKTGEVKVLDYLCDIYFIKYVNRMEYVKDMLGNLPDTVSCTYYIAKDLIIPHSDIFAALQGNHNSLILDGRFFCIPLKFEMKRGNGIVITIHAVKVEHGDMTKKLRLPDYPIQH